MSLLTAPAGEFVAAGARATVFAEPIAVLTSRTARMEHPARAAERDRSPAAGLGAFSSTLEAFLYEPENRIVYMVTGSGLTLITAAHFHLASTDRDPVSDSTARSHAFVEQFDDAAVRPLP